MELKQGNIREFVTTFVHEQLIGIPIQGFDD